MVFTIYQNQLIFAGEKIKGKAHFKQEQNHSYRFVCSLAILQLIYIFSSWSTLFLSNCFANINSFRFEVCEHMKILSRVQGRLFLFSHLK